MFMEQGGRLFLDGQPLFDHWIQDQWIHSHCNHGLNLMTLEPDQTYDLRLESRHGPGEARCQLFFRPMDLPSQPVARSVWLPDGDWIDLWTGVRASGPRTIQVQAPAQVIPMFVRAGSLFILAPPMQHTGEKPWDPITLDVYPHARRIARGELYEDDRCSNAYLNGAFRRTSVTVRLDALNKQVVLHIGEALGTFPGAPAERSWVLQVHRPPELQKVQRVLIDGQESQDWGSRPMGPAPTPFQVQGPALDAEVIEVALPSRPVSHGRRAVLEFY
jgi:hypothetical protein